MLHNIMNVFMPQSYTLLVGCLFKFIYLFGCTGSSL